VNLDRSARVARLPRPGETVLASEYSVATGGKGANQAVAAARLGATVTLSATVGTDGDATTVVGELERNGIDVSVVRRSIDLPTGTALITVDAGGENSIVVAAGANDEHRAEGLTTRLASNGGGILGLSLEIPVGVAEDAARIARASGGTVVTNLSPLRPGLETLIGLSSVILVNEHEAATLSGCHPGARLLSDFGTWFATSGASSAIVTLGERGAAVFEPDAKPQRVASVRVDAVDTTGCGDAFAGALVAELAAGSSLVDAATFACACAALAATRFGAQASYPSRAEVEEVLKA
jgi:ribokinase